jgi:hypothetical protein
MARCTAASTTGSERTESCVAKFASAVRAVSLGTSATALMAASRSAWTLLFRPRLANASVSMVAVSGSRSCLIARATIAGSSNAKNLSI